MLFGLSAAALWAIGGLILIILEVVTTSFVLLFFGVSALLVAGVKLATGLDSIALELVLFAVLGLAGLLLLRKKTLELFRKDTGYRGDERQTLVLNADIPAGAEGKVEYQGSTWTAVNSSGKAMKKGDKAVIVRVDGVKLILTK